MKTGRKVCQLAAVLLGGIATWAGAQAPESISTYPSKPIVVINGYAAGGPVDTETRLYLQKLTELYGWQFISDYNKPGAGTTIATSFVARSAPNGYTLLAVNPTFTIVPYAYKDLTFDVVKSFSPISLMSKKPYLVVVNTALPVTSIKELINYARQNPGKINYATPGSGGIIHLAGEWLHSATNTKVTYIHYKGASQVYLDLTAGLVQEYMASPQGAAGFVKAGKLRLLAVTTSERSKLFPDTPTIDETVAPEYDLSTWLGVTAPSGTPSAIIRKLNEAFVRVAKIPEISQRFASEGSISVGSTPEQFKKFIEAETARWGKIVRDANIKFEE